MIQYNSLSERLVSSRNNISRYSISTKSICIARHCMDTCRLPSWIQWKSICIPGRAHHHWVHCTMFQQPFWVCFSFLPTSLPHRSLFWLKALHFLSAPIWPSVPFSPHHSNLCLAQSWSILEGPGPAQPQIGPHPACGQVPGASQRSGMEVGGMCKPWDWKLGLIFWSWPGPH